MKMPEQFQGVFACRSGQLVNMGCDQRPTELGSRWEMGKLMGAFKVIEGLTELRGRSGSPIPDKRG